MPVVDASVAVLAVTHASVEGREARQLVRMAGTFPVPVIFAAETVSAVRGMVLRGTLPEVAGRRALGRLLRLRTVGHPFAPHALRVWSLRHNVPVYDACYIALAERLGTELVTADGALVAIAGLSCRVLPVSDYLRERLRP